MSPEPLRVLIVDDSRIFRAALQEALEARAGLRVVGSVWSGEKALEFIRQSPPDLVTLDLNMPGQGGLETLSQIQEINASRRDLPPVGVLLVSALTSRGAAATVEGLQRGAFDFIRKPDGPDEKANAVLLQQQLFEKIDLFTQRRARLSGAEAPTPKTPVAARIQRPGRFQAVAIGSSTGGPAALAQLFPVWTKQTSVPFFIVQHLPPGMTEYFANSLAKKCDYRIVEATYGEAVQPTTAYIAPGGKHMVVRNQDGRMVIALNDLPPENNCRPSADVLFRSLAAAYPPSSVLTVILTGMGTDGAKGLGPLKRNGAYVIAQDEATSVVWGMPGAAIATNQVDEVLPLDRIGTTVASLLGHGTTPCN